MKTEVQRYDRAKEALLVTTNSHLEIEAEFVEKSVKIAEHSTELGIQLNQIKVQSNEL